LISAQFCVQRPSLRSRVLGLKPGMRPHSSSPQMTNAPISCEIRAPGQPSPRTAHRRTYTFDEILEMALWCHPPARKCYLRELLNLSSLAGLPRVLPAVTTLRLESLFADGNLRHQRWLSVPTTVLRSQDLPRHPRWVRNRSQRSRSGPENCSWSDGAEQITGDARIDVLGQSCAGNILLQDHEKSCEILHRTMPRGRRIPINASRWKR
jgi:hypothetical protein